MLKELIFLLNRNFQKIKDHIFIVEGSVFRVRGKVKENHGCIYCVDMVASIHFLFNSVPAVTNSIVKGRMQW